MKGRLNALVVAATVVVALAFAAGNAAAVRAEPAGAIGSTSLGLITFRSPAGDVQCRVTFLGEVERSITNAEGAFFENITSGAANECRRGGATLLVAPDIWPAYLAEGFNLSGGRGSVELTVINVEFLIEIIGVTCLYSGGFRLNLPVSGSPLVTGLPRITSTSVTRFSGSIFCPTTVTLAGTFEMSRQTITL